METYCAVFAMALVSRPHPHAVAPRMNGPAQGLFLRELEMLGQEDGVHQVALPAVKDITLYTWIPGSCLFGCDSPVMKAKMVHIA
jgi:hypothetical protein